MRSFHHRTGRLLQELVPVVERKTREQSRQLREQRRNGKISCSSTGSVLVLIPRSTKLDFWLHSSEHSNGSLRRSGGHRWGAFFSMPPYYRYDHYDQNTSKR